MMIITNTQLIFSPEEDRYIEVCQVNVESVYTPQVGNEKV